MDANQSLLTVRQAAERLDISVEAVRARLNRGTLERVDGDDGTVYVRLDAPTRSDQTDAQALIVKRLDSEVSYLRERLALADERDREQRRIIAALTSRIPELTAGGKPEAPDDDLTGREAAHEGEPRPATVGAQEGVQRPWWRKVFGG